MNNGAPGSGEDKPADNVVRVGAIPATRRAEPESYRPRIPWRGVAVVSGVVLLSAVGYCGNTWRKERALRRDLRSARSLALRRYGKTYSPLRDATVDMLREATAVPYPGDFRDPAFAARHLQKARGLYARVRLPGLERSTTGLLRAARQRSRDAFAACLRVAPHATADLVGAGEVLEPSFGEEIERAGSELRLRVLDRMLVDALRRDLPKLDELRGLDYVLAVVDETADPSGGPVRLYAWDLREKRLLLRLRTTPEGMVVPVRWEGAGRPSNDPVARQWVANTANDCALAAYARERTGEPDTLPPAPPPVAPPPPAKAPAAESVRR